MNFFKTSVLSGIQTAAKLVLGLLTNKLIAIYIGSEGFAIVGQFKDLLKTGSSLGQLGLDKGLVKYSALYENKKAELRQILSTAVIAQLVVSAVLAFVTIIFREPILNLLVGNSEQANLIWIIALGLLPMVFHSTLLSILNGWHLIKKYVWVSIIEYFAASILTLALIYFFRLDGLLISLGLVPVLKFLIVICYLRYHNFDWDYFFDGFKTPPLKKLLHFSAMTISGTISLSLVLIATRKILSAKFGLDYAGYWEALWRISSLFVMVLTSAFGFYLLPTFSKLYTKYLRKEIFNIWKITIPTTILAGLILFFLKDFVIQLIFSEEFLVISGLIGFQILGGILKVNSWVLGNLILAKAHTKVFIGVQVGWALLFFLLSLLFLNLYGFWGISVAYFVAYLIHFIFMNVYFKKLLWRKA